MTRRQGRTSDNRGKPKETRDRHPEYPISQKQLDCPSPASRPQTWRSPAEGPGYKAPCPQERGRMEEPPRACTGELSSPCMQWQVLVGSRGPSPSSRLTGHPESCPVGSERGKARASRAVRADTAGEWGPGSDPQTPPPYPTRRQAWPRVGSVALHPQTCTLCPRDTRKHALSGGHRWALRRGQRESRAGHSGQTGNGPRPRARSGTAHSQSHVVLPQQPPGGGAAALLGHDSD